MRGGVLSLLVLLLSMGEARAEFKFRVDVGENAVAAMDRLVAAARALPETAAILRDGILLAIENIQKTIDKTANRLDQQQAAAVNDVAALIDRADSSVAEAMDRLDGMQQSVFDNLRDVLLKDPRPTVIRLKPILVFPGQKEAEINARGTSFDRFKVSYILDGRADTLLPSSSRDIRTFVPASQTGAGVRPLVLQFSEPASFWSREKLISAYQTTVRVLPDKLGTATLLQWRETTKVRKEEWTSSENRYEMNRETGGGELREEPCEDLPAGVTWVGQLQTLQSEWNADGARMTPKLYQDPNTKRFKACVYFYHPGSRCDRCGATRTITKTRLRAPVEYAGAVRETKDESKPVEWDRDVGFTPDPGWSWALRLETYDGAIVEWNPSSPKNWMWFTVDHRPSETRVIVRPFGPTKTPPWLR